MGRSNLTAESGHLGFRSIFLLLGAFHGVVIAIVLLFYSKNRIANRFLALTLVALAMTMTPQILGFAGFYHRHPWLTFAPFNITFAFGPLFYLYLHTIIHENHPPPKWFLHLIPGAIQFAYYSVLFTFPVETKYRYDDVFHSPYISPLESVGVLMVTMTYLIQALKLFNRYQSWLPHAVSDRENYRLVWLRAFLLATMSTYLVWAGFEVTQLFTSLSYVQIFPMYMVVAVLTYYLAIEGFRNAGILYPAFKPESIPLQDDAPSTPEDDSENGSLERFAEEIRSKVEADELYLDPTLSLRDLAQMMATNTSKCSKAINTGLGMNFNEFINRYRVEKVQAALAAAGSHGDVLTIALDCGFNSKTNFNRTFKKFTGLTPLAYKKDLETRTTS